MPKSLVPLDLTKLELQNAVIQVLGSDPSSPNAGQVYTNSTSDRIRQYDGSVWQQYVTEDDLGAFGAGDVSQSGNSGGAGRLKVSAGANKVITDYSTAGIVKSDGNGVASAAVSGTDYAPATSGSAILKGNGSGGFSNAVSGTDYAPATSGSGLLKGNGSGGFSTAVADTDYATPSLVSSSIATAVTGLLDYKGSIDASTNPNFPAASKGDFYKISVAGKIGGASGTVVQAGDSIVANADNAGGTLASVGTSWDVIQGNVEAATDTSVGYVELATQGETEARSSSVLAVTPASLATFPRKAVATIGNASDTAITVTDNLGTKDKIASVRYAADDVEVICDIKYDTTNTTIFTFAVAPASNAIKVVIIG
jgi:hypothetical protein